jgi:hypothetical protein
LRLQLTLLGLRTHSLSGGQRGHKYNICPHNPKSLHGWAVAMNTAARGAQTTRTPAWRQAQSKSARQTHALHGRVPTCRRVDQLAHHAAVAFMDLSSTVRGDPAAINHACSFLSAFHQTCAVCRPALTTCRPACILRSAQFQTCKVRCSRCVSLPLHSQVVLVTRQRLPHYKMRCAVPPCDLHRKFSPNAKQFTQRKADVVLIESLLSLLGPNARQPLSSGLVHKFHQKEYVLFKT